MCGGDNGLFNKNCQDCLQCAVWFSKIIVAHFHDNYLRILQRNGLFVRKITHLIALP